MNRVLYRGVVSADRLQPPSDRPARHGDVRAAVPRSVQLRLRSADPAGIDLVGAAMHARFAAEGKAGVTMRGGSTYSTLVERRPAHHRVLPQPDRPAHRDDRRARRRSRFRSCPSGSCRAAICRFRSRRRRGTSASRSTTRSRPTAPCWISRRAIARRCSTTSTGWGGTPSTAAAATRGPRRRGACERGAGRPARRRSRAPPRRSTACCAIRSSATRAATSCRRISPIS